MRIISLVLMLLVIVVMMFGSPASAQQAAAEPGTIMHMFDHFVVKGGIITWFVLIPLSVAALALTLEHCLSIRRSTVIPKPTVERLTELLSQQRYVEALEFTAADPSVVAYIVHNGLTEASCGFAAMERVILESLEDRAARMMRKIEYLNVIGNVGPMIGLFGTVVGMIRMFGSIGELGGKLDAGRIAGDISIALVATFWGLLIAIPSLSIFAVFRNRIDVLTADCALTAERLLAVFKPGAEPTLTAAVARAAS